MQQMNEESFKYTSGTTEAAIFAPLIYTSMSRT